MKDMKSALLLLALILMLPAFYLVPRLFDSGTSKALAQVAVLCVTGVIGYASVRDTLKRHRGRAPHND